MRAIGASIAAGRLYLCALDPSDDHLGTPVPGSAHRFEENAGLSEADRHADLTARVRRHLEPLHAERAVLTEVRKFAQWKYADARTHVLAVAALMTACHSLSVMFTTVKTDPLARTVAVMADKLASTDPALFGYEARPQYWTAGMGAAHVAAGYALQVTS